MRVELGGAGSLEVTRRSGNGRPHMAVMCEREGVSAEVRKLEENTPFGKYASAAWAEWTERGAGGLWGVAGRRGRGWAELAKIRRKFLFE
jgi:hypothetical protein